VVAIDLLAVFVLGLGMARSVAAGLARAQRSRKGRDIAVLASAVAAATVWLATQAIGPLLEVAHRSRSVRIVNVLSWLPPGWLAQSVVDAHTGRTGPALLRMLGGAAAAAISLALWGRTTRRMMEQSERVVETHQGSGLAGPPLGAAKSRFGAAIAKELRYLRRSPLRRTQLLILSVMGVGLAVFQAVRLRPGSGVAFTAMMATIIGVGPAMNIIGFDCPSLWLEVVAGGPDRTVLRARSLSYVPQVAIPTIVAALVLGAWKGSWTSAIAVVLLAPSLGLIGVGLGAWVSPRIPIAQRDSDNAFAWRNSATGKGCTSSLYAIGSVIGVGVVAAPIVVPTIIWRERPWVLLIPVAGAAWAVVVWLAGTNLGERYLRWRGPELLAELSSKAA
jgi:ABC-2 type transport system permease protein